MSKIPSGTLEWNEAGERLQELAARYPMRTPMDMARLANLPVEVVDQFTACGWIKIVRPTAGYVTYIVLDSWMVDVIAGYFRINAGLAASLVDGDGDVRETALVFVQSLASAAELRRADLRSGTRRPF